MNTKKQLKIFTMMYRTTNPISRYTTPMIEIIIPNAKEKPKIRMGGVGLPYLLEFLHSSPSINKRYLSFRK